MTPVERQRYQQGEYALLVRRPWCKGCNICVEACPQHILALDAHQKVYVTDIGQCIFCGLCAVRCPDFVFVLERPETLSSPRGALSLNEVKGSGEVKG